MINIKQINSVKTDLSQVKQLYIDIIKDLLKKNINNDSLENLEKDILQNEELYENLNNELDIMKNDFENHNNFLNDLKDELEVILNNYKENFLFNNYKDIYKEKIEKIKNDGYNDQEFLDNMKYKIDESCDIIDNELENIEELLNL